MCKLFFTCIQCFVRKDEVMEWETNWAVSSEQLNFMLVRELVNAAGRSVLCSIQTTE